MRKVCSALAGISLIASLTLSGVSASAEELVVNQDTDLINNPAMVTVLAEVNGQFSVTIPKVMVLTLQNDGSYQCDYTVDVDGRIADNSYVSVIPESEITISTPGKDDVLVAVTQGIHNFRSATYTGDLSGKSDTTKIDVTDSTPEATGNLRVKDEYTLTSGTWEGTLMFDISLNWDEALGN